MKKLLAIVVLGLLWSNFVIAKNPFGFTWNIETSSGQSYSIIFKPKNSCLVVDYHGGAGCSYTQNGNKIYVNINNSHMILEGTTSMFSKKIKGKWQSQSKITPNGTFWGTSTD